MKKKFAVTIHYTGVSTYIIEADNAEKAKLLAEASYAEGEEPAPFCSDWERMSSADVSELPVQNQTI